MKSKKPCLPALLRQSASRRQAGRKNTNKQVSVLAPRTEERNPELIEKFYKQIINSFGYAYPAKV